jgi:hypothetical protein
MCDTDSLAAPQQGGIGALVHHLKRQLHQQLVTIGMREDVRAVSNAEIEPK